MEPSVEHSVMFSNGSTVKQSKLSEPMDSQSVTESTEEWTSKTATRSIANPSVSLESVPPVFLRERDFKGQPVTAIDICRAVTRCIQQTKLEGVQSLNNLWRIYLKDKGVPPTAVCERIHSYQWTADPSI